MKIIMITGMAGAGKGITAAVAESLGYAVFVCGDVIRDEARRRGLPETPENLGRTMLQIRKEEGAGAVTKRLISKIAGTNSHLVLVEGVRSLEEIDELRREFGEIKTLAIHASPLTRFKRIRERGRPDDPKDWNDFKERDLRELEVGIGKVIALGDKMIVNEGTVDELEVKARKALKAM